MGIRFPVGVRPTPMGSDRATARPTARPTAYAARDCSDEKSSSGEKSSLDKRKEAVTQGNNTIAIVAVT